MKLFQQEDLNPPYDEFADIWNAFITSLREEDLLSNRFAVGVKLYFIY
jgi:hypothetical protein